MEDSSSYPLEQLATIKLKKLEEAEKELNRKKEALEKELETLRKVEKDRDEVKNHRTEKLEQLRSGLDEGLPSLKIEQMRTYLKIVDEKLYSKEIKVTEQKKLVTAAEQEVEKARELLLKRQQDVEKLKLHRKEWDQEMQKELLKKESLESDELGSIIHERKKHRPPRKES